MPSLPLLEIRSMGRLLGTVSLLCALACRQAAPIPGDLVDDAGRRVSLSAQPQRVVSLIPATTELLFALGAGARLVGRTHWCDYPAEAAQVPDLGNGIGPNIEAVVQARPDLVLLYKSANNSVASERLRGLGIAVLELTTDRISDFARITRLLGRALGTETAAESLLAGMDRELEGATRRAPDSASAPTVFILVWDRPPLTLGRGSFLSEIIARAGGRNLFEDIAAPSAPVAIEAVAARDPDYILTSSEDLPEIARLEEWQVVRAVRERRFLRIRGSEFNRPSPRIAAAVRQLAVKIDSARR